MAQTGLKSIAQLLTRASIPTTTGQSHNVTRPDCWLTKFSKLRVDRARGDPAPHRPLLLLVLCDLAEGGGNQPTTAIALSKTAH